MGKVTVDLQTIDKRKDDYSPLISIVTVVLNNAKTLEQTILSVINQSYQNKEYIIIDGGSTDGSLEIIKKYAPFLTFWCSEPDNGIYDAMNKGISKSTGDIIGIINSDDWYETGILAIIAAQYKNSPYNIVTHGLLRLFYNNEFYAIIGNSVRKIRYDMIQHPTCFIPKRLYDEFGTYDACLKYSADYELILRFIGKGVKFDFVENVIANFRIGGISSFPAADKEMFKIRYKYKLISRSELTYRILYVNMTSLIKKFLS